MTKATEETKEKWDKMSEDKKMEFYKEVVTTTIEPVSADTPNISKDRLTVKITPVINTDKLLENLTDFVARQDGE